VKKRKKKESKERGEKSKAGKKRRNEKVGLQVGDINSIFKSGTYFKDSLAL
jgi:hypothetical protein